MALSSSRPKSRDKRRENILKDVTDKTETRRLSVDFDSEFYKQMRVHAAMTGTGLTDITRRLWAEYMEKVSK